MLTFESTIDGVKVYVHYEYDKSNDTLDIRNVTKLSGEKLENVLQRHEIFTRLLCEAWGEVGMHH